MTIMRTKLSFLLLAVALVFTACNPESSILQSSEIIQSVENRSSTVEVACTVDSYEIIIEEIVLALSNFDTEVSELSIAENQTIQLENSNGQTQTITVAVSSFEIIIEEIVLAISTPNGIPTGYSISANQVLEFIE